MFIKSDISKEGVFVLIETFAFSIFLIWLSRNHLFLSCFLGVIAVVFILFELSLLTRYEFQDELVTISSVYRKKMFYYKNITNVYYSSGGRGDGPYIHVQKPSVFLSGCRFNNEYDYFVALRILTDHGVKINFKGYDKKAQKEILREIAAVSL